ncbi:MAG: gliding motility-associated C-terminal domain-containing protein, partial [Flavobacteriales bacterium]|nr:gliding motility-associated C-terminal domain-containing protein [Flavobacteriales bacterium]
CDGSATVMAGGGTTPYTYSWTNGQTTTSASGLCAGPNNVNITDGNGCSTSASVIISEPNPLVITDSIINPTCNGYSDGAIYLNVTGGTPFYSYGWFPNVGNGPIVTNLAVDTLAVTVTDINGCVNVAILQLTEPTPITATGIGFNSTCSSNNGVAVVSPSGGTPPFSYLWDDPLYSTTDSVFDLLTRDPYYVEITDANGCQLIYSIAVGDEPSPELTVISTSLTCNGDNSGSATVTVTNGTPIFTYSWGPSTGGQTGPTATGLAAGTASVVVVDANGCIDNAVVIVTEPSPLSVITNQDTTICYNDDKIMIYAQGSGGTTPYIFAWDNGLDSISMHLVSPNITTVYNGLVIDANGCVVSATPITITVTPPLQVLATGGPMCIGDSIDVNAVITGGNGVPYTYVWIGLGLTTSTITVAPPSDATYTVEVSDGCSIDATATAFVTVNPVPEIGFTASGEGCEPLVTVNVLSTGPGVDIISWLWDFGDGYIATDANSATHIYDSAGVYDITLTVISSKNCPFDTMSPGVVTIFPDPNADFEIWQGLNELIPAVTSILTPTIDFVNTSSSGVDSLVWDFGDPESGNDNYSNLENPSHMYTDTGTYTVWLTVYTPEGCIDSISYDVRIVGDYIIFAPNAFTPDDDGDNDYFFPKGVGVDGSSFELYIFDRWGDLIATVKGIWSDDMMIGWDGRANNGTELAQIDVYVWLIRTEDFNGDGHEYIGHVTLLR